jgi:outer membrane lipoprotein-sorting protein
MFRSTPAHILTVAVLLVPLIAARVGYCQEYSGRELLAGYTEMVTSIETLYCEYNVHRSRDGTVTKMIFARDGQKWHFGYPATSADNNANTGRKIICSDGERVYSYSIAGSKVGTVQIHDYTRPSSADIAPDQFLGLRLSNLDRAVFDIFAADGRNWETLTRKDRIWLAAGTVKSHEVSVEDLNVAVYIDPLRGFLPIEIQITLPDGHKQVGKWQMRYTIQEILEVQDESLEKSRLFPHRATLEQDFVGNKTLELTVSNVRINAELDVSLFRPAIPDGTTVADVSSVGPPTLGIKGDDATVDARIRKLTKDAEADVGRGTKVVAAIFAVTAFVLSVFLSYRYRNRSSSGGTRV